MLSIVYGALVALGQGDLKRRIAYTSVNHMGYAVLGIAVAGAAARPATRPPAAWPSTGATVEMVAHGLITGVAVPRWPAPSGPRTEDYDLDALRRPGRRGPRAHRGH